MNQPLKIQLKSPNLLVIKKTFLGDFRDFRKKLPNDLPFVEKLFLTFNQKYSWVYNNYFGKHISSTADLSTNPFITQTLSGSSDFAG